MLNRVQNGIKMNLVTQNACMQEMANHVLRLGMNVLRTYAAMINETDHLKLGEVCLVKGVGAKINCM